MPVIVLIDDDSGIREIAEIALTRIGGHEVHTAASGPEGMQLVRRHRPDVVVVDVMMPGMDGRAVAAALRDDPQLAGVGLVFLTAKAGADELAELTACGAAGVITKPFDPMTLSESLGALVSWG
jgi:CheY-like chemotaxis protein